MRGGPAFEMRRRISASASGPECDRRRARRHAHFRYVLHPRAVQPPGPRLRARRRAHQRAHRHGDAVGPPGAAPNCDAHCRVRAPLRLVRISVRQPRAMRYAFPYARPRCGSCTWCMRGGCADDSVHGRVCGPRDVRDVQHDGHGHGARHGPHWRGGRQLPPYILRPLVLPAHHERRQRRALHARAGPGCGFDLCYQFIWYLVYGIMSARPTRFS